jgi:hypothetical protein
MDTYIPRDIIVSHILPKCDLDTLIQQACATNDHAFILDTLYSTIKTFPKNESTSVKMSFLAYIIKHYHYDKILSIKKEFEILCFEDYDEVVDEVLKHPDDRVLNLFCAPCSVCAGEMIPRAIWLNLSHRIWNASFEVMPTLYDVFLMIQLCDKVGIEAFFRRLRNTPLWLRVLRKDLIQCVNEMDEGVEPDTDPTRNLLYNISLLLKSTHRDKHARWVYKKAKYFQKLLNIDYFVEVCGEYYNNIEDAQDDYDY